MLFLGAAVQEELTSKAYCETLHELAQKTMHDNVRQKLLELIQSWAFAFRNNPKHNSLKVIHIREICIHLCVRYLNCY